MFKVVGDLEGIPTWLGWDGVFVGAPEAVAAVDRFLHESGGYVSVTPTGPVLRADKSDEQSAFVVAYNVLDDVEVVAGEAPELPDTSVPDGADA